MVSTLFLFFMCAMMCISTAFALNQSEVISSYNSALVEKGINVGIYSVALSKLRFSDFLGTQYDAFLKNVSICSLNPRESILIYQFTLHEDDVGLFLNTPVVKELPQSVVEKLDMLRISKGPTIMTEAFSRLYPNQELGIDVFEIGHIIVKIFFENNQFSVLVLAPSLTGSTSKGCFSKQFMQQFTGKASNIQDYLAIKAAMDQQFAQTLLTFKLGMTNQEVIDLMGLTNKRTLTLNNAAEKSVVLYFGEISLSDNSKRRWWEAIPGVSQIHAWVASQWQNLLSYSCRPHFLEFVGTVGATTFVVLFMFALLAQPPFHPSTVVDIA